MTKSRRKPLTDDQFEQRAWILLGVCLLVGLSSIVVVLWAVVRLVLRYAP